MTVQKSAAPLTIPVKRYHAQHFRLHDHVTFVYVYRSIRTSKKKKKKKQKLIRIGSRRDWKRNRDPSRA
ncbi:Cat eye syndrome critical region protein 2, partial [Frankliniella fusca]